MRMFTREEQEAAQTASAIANHLAIKKASLEMTVNIAISAIKEGWAPVGKLKQLGKGLIAMPDVPPEAKELIRTGLKDLV